MSDVKLTVDQQAPASNGAVSTPIDGSWAPATYSFKVMARYADDATDIDNFGVDRATVAAWDNITVANNDLVVIPVTLDTRRPFTFQVIRQTAGAYVEGNAGALIHDAELTVTQSAVDTYEITLDSGTSGANLDINDSANLLEFSPPTTPGVVYRDKTGRAYQGDKITRSFLDARSVEQMIITGDANLATDTTGKITLQRWKLNTVYLKLEFPDAAATSLYQTFHGMIQNLSWYSQRTPDETIQIIFDVDQETIS